MKNTSLLLGLGLSAGLLLSFALPRPPSGEDPNAAPGPQHKILEKMAGTFTSKMSLWLEPGVDPVEVEGKNEAAMILGGRFLMSHNFAVSELGETESYSIMGYDRGLKRFTFFVFDTDNTKASYWDGVQKEKGGPIVLKDPYGVTELTLKLREGGALERELKVLAGKEPWLLMHDESERMEPGDDEEEE